MKNSALTFVPMLTTPLLLFLVLWLIYGLPEQAIVTADYFWLHVTMILLTILLIPAGLKYVTRERHPKVYMSLCVIRMSIFQLLVIVNEVFYFCYTNMAFFYLAIVTWAAMLFCFPTKKPEEVIPESVEKTETNETSTKL